MAVLKENRSKQERKDKAHTKILFYSLTRIDGKRQAHSLKERQMKEVKGSVEFMEEIPREELVRLRVIEEKVKTLGRFLEKQAANEETIRMIFDWPTEELPFEIEARKKEKIPIDSVTVCQMFKEGQTPKEIAEKSGLRYYHVRAILKAAGLIGSASYD